VGDQCWTHPPTPGQVERESPGWSNTHEGIGYARSFERAMADAAAHQYAHDVAAAHDSLTPSREALGLPPASLLSPQERVARDGEIMTEAGLLGTTAMLGSNIASLFGGTNMEAPLQLINTLGVVDDALGAFYSASSADANQTSLSTAVAPPPVPMERHTVFWVQPR
jgi:hypothetical protein